MPAPPIAVNIVLDAEARGLMRTTLARLRHAGLEDALVIEALGVVSGRIAADKVSALWKVPGVKAVKEDSVATPPPEPGSRAPRRRSET